MNWSARCRCRGVFFPFGPVVATSWLVRKFPRSGTLSLVSSSSSLRWPTAVTSAAFSTTVSKKWGSVMIGHSEANVSAKGNDDERSTDFTWKNYDNIKDDLKKLELFRSNLDRYRKTCGSNENSRAKVMDRLELLESVVEKQILFFLETPQGSRNYTKVRAELFVDKLMTTPIELIDETSGMRVLRNIIDLETESRYDMLIRSVTEPFWQACLDTVDEPNVRNRVCAVGTTGIGKTLTTPFLIRMLLMRGKTVVYHIRTADQSGLLYEFTPILLITTTNSNSSSDAAANDVNDIQVTVYSDHDFVHRRIKSLADPATFYIVDPGMAKTTCDPGSSASFKAKVIIVASPDSRLWGGEQFRKSRRDATGYFKYYPVWTLGEALAAGPFMNVPLSEQVISNRFRLTGGIPGRIFVREFGFLKQSIKRGVKLLTEELTEKIIRKDYIHLDNREESSRVLGFALGHFSQGPSFSDRTVDIMAPAVEEAVYSKNMNKKLWTMMLDPTIPGGRAAFQVFMRHVISQGGVGFSLENLFFAGKETTSGRRTTQAFERCTEIRVASDPMEAAQAKAGILFHSNPPKNPCVDFIYQDTTGHFHAFQATLAENQDITVASIRELELKVGAEHLSLYYLVSPLNFEDFHVNLIVKEEDTSDDVACAVYKVLVPGAELFKVAPRADDLFHEVLKRAD